MKNLFFLFAIIGFSVKAYSQNEIMKKLLFKEFDNFSTIFNDQPIVGQNCCNGEGMYNIIAFDSFETNIPTSYPPGKNYIGPTKLFTIKLTYANQFPINIPYERRIKFESDTLTYYVLGDYISGYYKLFGFYNTDILRFIDKIELIGLEKLKDDLILNGILSEKQADEFAKSIIEESVTYSTEMGKPCEILKYYFSEENVKKANTIILPKEPLIPLGF